MRPFKHELVEKLDITSEDTPDGRYYLTPSGFRFPSVTTVLGRKLDKTGLEQWKKRIGDKEAERIGNSAARRGSAVHSLAEKYVLNEVDYANGAMPIHLDSFLPLKRVLDERVGKIYGVEIPLYSKTLNTAGRTDLVAEFDGVLSVIDIKTSRKHKR